jgi:hypothetical protein
MNIEITGIAYLIFLLIVLLLTIQLAVLTKIIVQVRKYIQHNSLDLMTIYGVFGQVNKLNKKVDNARKRDERMLREIHKSDKNNYLWYTKIGEFNNVLSTLLDGIVKLNKNIDGNTRHLIKSDLESQSRLGFIKKGIEKSGKVLTLLEDTLTKAKAKKC